MAATAANGVFGASEALPRWKTSVEQRVMWLVASFCKPRLRQAPDRYAPAGDSAVETSE